MNSDYLVSWRYCWVSSVIPLKTRRNLVLLVFLGCVPSTLTIN